MWSYILEALGMSGSFLIARKNRWGWVVGFINNICWSFYGYYTKQYGFVVAGFITTAIQIYGFINFRRK
jgi:hypothetical protein